ncbi:gamma secretase complex protein, partial [Nowakowskiella sp. JEL0078]
MPLLAFVGNALTAFGPALAVFFLYVRKAPQNVILALTAAFFWLVGVLLASLAWFAGAKGILGMGVAVVFQELMRAFFYWLYGKMEKSLDAWSDTPHSKLNRPTHAFMIGYGMGLASSVVLYVGSLAESIGSGTMPCTSCPSMDVFFVGAIHTVLFWALHVFWNIVFWEMRVVAVAAVVLSHLGTSFV